MKDIFTKLTVNHLWGEKTTMCGTGSSIRETGKVSEGLVNFINTNNIKSIIDMCGDLNWQHLYLNKVNVKYYGYDIVDEVIKQAHQNAIKNKVQVEELKSLNLLELNKHIKLNQDMIILRDILVHFTKENVEQVLSMLKQSDIKYIACTSFPAYDLEYVKRIGDWRPLNMDKVLGTPYHVIEEDIKGKTLSIYINKGC